MDAQAGDAGIYVRPFGWSIAQLQEHKRDAGSSGTSRPSMIAKGLVDMLRWRGDGKELYYRDQSDGKVMAVEVTGKGSVFGHGDPVHLFTVPPNLLPVRNTPTLADVTRDGQRFLFALRADAREELTVVLNWTAGHTEHSPGLIRPSVTSRGFAMLNREITLPACLARPNRPTTASVPARRSKLGAGRTIRNHPHIRRTHTTAHQPDCQRGQRSQD